jgi:hypothetical protein
MGPWRNTSRILRPVLIHEVAHHVVLMRAGSRRAMRARQAGF